MNAIITKSDSPPCLETTSQIRQQHIKEILEPEMALLRWQTAARTLGIFTKSNTTVHESFTDQ